MNSLYRRREAFQKVLPLHSQITTLAALPMLGHCEDAESPLVMHGDARFHPRRAQMKDELLRQRGESFQIEVPRSDVVSWNDGLPEVSDTRFA